MVFDGVFCGMARDAVGFKKFFDRAVGPAQPVYRKVELFDVLRESDCSVEKALFQQCKKSQCYLRSETGFFIHVTDCKRNGVTAQYCYIRIHHQNVYGPPLWHEVRTCVHFVQSRADTRRTKFRGTFLLVYCGRVTYVQQ